MVKLVQLIMHFTLVELKANVVWQEQSVVPDTNPVEYATAAGVQFLIHVKLLDCQ